MTPEQNTKCHTIIHVASASAASIGAGLAQIPCSDNAAIIPIQLAMVMSLGSVFGIRLQQTAAESTLGTASATMLGRSISQVFVGWMPLFGNISNALTAGAVTEIIGWAVANDFSNRTKSNHSKKEQKNADHKR